MSLSSNSSYLKEDIICNCMVVSYQKLKEKIDQGCHDFNKLTFETGACTACGSCRPKILDILGQAAWTSAKIHLSHQFNKDVDAFVIESLYSKFHPFFAGQYVLIKLQIDSMWLERAYTLVSPSKDSQHYEIIIKKYSEGAFSRWLFQHANETLFIWVSQPNGQFILKPSQKPILCFAGGVGITPFIAFLRDLQKGNSNNKFYIFYSLTHIEDAVIPDDVKDYLKTTADVTIEIWDTATKGRMNAAIIEKTVKNIDPEFIYICGTEGFEKLILDQLQVMKFNSNNVLTEKFVPAG
ncbi:MAG: (2Fe-2S)-binding protein [Gammaproteobacteria bacterium]